MSEKEILSAMVHNAKGMIEMGLATNNMNLALVGHATLVAIAAVNQGDQMELQMTLAAYAEMMVEKHKVQAEKEFEPEFKSMLKEMGIDLNQD